MIRLCFAAAFSLCICMLGCKSEQKDTQSSAPHQTTPTTAPSVKPYTDTSITHFWFETDNDDPPGRREWVKNADQWEERYEDGHVTKFKIVKMVSEGQYQRPQVLRIADDKFDDQLEVLLPAPVEGAWFEFRRPGETEWHRYRQIHLYPIRTTAPASR
ncbi:MAG TPA: hypothetical protein VGP94_05265 [Tepidisphaeraceae bacterium]|jgi:hypothetical protein|nr:hypothetical protein [Tepidisphaeraceae bacterium]